MNAQIHNQMIINPTTIGDPKAFIRDNWMTRQGFGHDQVASYLLLTSDHHVMAVTLPHTGSYDTSRVQPRFWVGIEYADWALEHATPDA